MSARGSWRHAALGDERRKRTGQGEIDMSVKMRTTCTWTERPYEALLFPGIGFGPFLRSLGGRRRRPPSGGARAISEIPLWKSSDSNLVSDPRAKGQSQVDSFYGA